MPLTGRTSHSPSSGRGSPFAQSTAHAEPLSKVFAKAEEEAVHYARGISPRTAAVGVFKDYPDFSSINDARPHPSKVDTFQTPTSLHQRKDVPARMDKRYGLGDTRDLIDICEIGFARSMRALEKDITRASREEMQQATEAMRKETRDALESREVRQCDMMKQVQDQLDIIIQETTGPAKLDFSSADLAPLRDFLHCGDRVRWEAQHDAISRLQSRFEGEVAHVLEEVNSLRRQQDQMESVLLPEIRNEIQKAHRATEDALSRSEKHLERLIGMQEAVVLDAKQAVQGVHRLQEDGVRCEQTLAPFLDAKFTMYVREQAVNVDFAQVFGKITKVEKAVSSEFRGMLSEIAKIQQALHLDFVQVMGEISEIGKKRDDEVSATRKSMETLMGALEDGKQAWGSEMSRTLSTTAKPKVKTRVREFWSQTDGQDVADAAVQTVPMSEKRGKPKRVSGDTPGDDAKKTAAEGKTDKRVFADAEAMKAKAREAAMRPAYNVFDYYHHTGLIQKVAKSRMFEIGTLFVIFVNAVWISVDADNNKATVLIDAHPVFQVAENLFCCYFTWEVLIRFLAFRRKVYCLRDGWFVFDSLLVTMMIIETWVFSIFFLAMGGDSGSGDMGSASMLRMVRMVKMLRISRLARLLRAIPELVILMKGIGAAARSVLVFLVLWLIIIYVFAVICRQLTDGEAIGEKYFVSVPVSMNTLLLDGILPDNSEIVNDLAAANPVLWPVLMIFILLACITLMYMLVGVLVEIVAVIASTEKERMTVSAVASEMREALQDQGRNLEGQFSKHEFQQLLMSPEIVRILHDVGVDVVVLMDMTEMIFEDLDRKGSGMDFTTLMDIVLNMRGTNPATVKDTVELLRVIKAVIKDNLAAQWQNQQAELKQLKTAIQELNDADREEEGEEDD